MTPAMNFEWKMGRRWVRIWCAVFSHRLYRASSSAFYEIGCERCKMHFRATYYPPSGDLERQ